MRLVSIDFRRPGATAREVVMAAAVRGGYAEVTEQMALQAVEVLASEGWDKRTEVIAPGLFE